mmetsp:Transcript_93862/g.297913  ORF Transcript_93862/g.297913 Transcript_93862/m.297913 type:complete len:89 (+) Transcript_93862:294-560(+)
MPPGFAGPKTAFWQCAREAKNGDGEEILKTTPWGTTMGHKVKADLKSRGFTTHLCPKDVETGLVDRATPKPGQGGVAVLNNSTAMKTT